MLGPKVFILLALAAFTASVSIPEKVEVDIVEDVTKNTEEPKNKHVNHPHHEHKKESKEEVVQLTEVSESQSITPTVSKQTTEDGSKIKLVEQINREAQIYRTERGDLVSIRFLRVAPLGIDARNEPNFMMRRRNLDMELNPSQSQMLPVAVPVKMMRSSIEPSMMMGGGSSKGVVSGRYLSDWLGGGYGGYGYNSPYSYGGYGYGGYNSPYYGNMGYGYGANSYLGSYLGGYGGYGY